MNSAPNLVDAAARQCPKLDSQVEVGQHVKCCQTVQQISAIPAIHTANHDVARRDRLNCPHGIQVYRQRHDPSAEPDIADCLSEHLDLEAAEIRVGGAAHVDAVKVLPFDPVMVDQDETANTEANELLDQRAASPRASNHRYSHAAQPLDRPSPKGLGMAPDKFRQAEAATVRVPVVQVLAGDRYQLD